MATETDPQPHTLVIVGVWEKILGGNDNRKRYMVQNLGPGNVFRSIASKPQNDTSGYTIVVGASWIDDPPWVHCGEVWVSTDTANTIIKYSEWT